MCVPNMLSKLYIWNIDEFMRKNYFFLKLNYVLGIYLKPINTTTNDPKWL